MSPFRALLPATALVLAGCAASSDALPQRGVEPIQTDRLEYVARGERQDDTYRTHGFRLVARFENRTGKPIYLNRCSADDPHPQFGVVLVTLNQGVSSGYELSWECDAEVAPIEVAPGESRVDTLDLSGLNMWDGYTVGAREVLKGQYRLFYEAQSCPRRGECRIRADLARSNVFNVRVEG